MSRPPICDAACQLKILLNSSSLEGNVGSAHKSLTHYFQQGGKLDGPNSTELLTHLAKMEDDATDLHKMILRHVGYSGPLPKHLQ